MEQSRLEQQATWFDMPTNGGELSTGLTRSSPTSVRAVETPGRTPNKSLKVLPARTDYERPDDRWSAVNAAANALYFALGEPRNVERQSVVKRAASCNTAKGGRTC
jgi:hypothetical protein